MVIRADLVLLTRLSLFVGPFCVNGQWRRDPCHLVYPWLGRSWQSIKLIVTFAWLVPEDSVQRTNQNLRAQLFNLQLYRFHILMICLYRFTWWRNPASTLSYSTLSLSFEAAAAVTFDTDSKTAGDDSNNQHFVEMS